MNNEIKHNQWTVFAQKHFFLSESFFCRVFALCVFLTLSLHPITAQTNTQQSTPDYYSIAEDGVKKYYPEYEEYFKGIIKDIKWLWDYEQYLFNKETNRNLLNAWGLLKNEKEIITTILISMEKVHWIEDFKKKIWISEDSNINDISNDIINWFFRKHEKTQRNLENFKREITKWVNNIWEEFITISEKYMVSLKEFFIDYWFIKESKETQDWIKTYIDALQKTGRTPSKIGQRYIDEYNKIIKK